MTKIIESNKIQPSWPHPTIRLQTILRRDLTPYNRTQRYAAGSERLRPDLTVHDRNRPQNTRYDLTWLDSTFVTRFDRTWPDSTYMTSFDVQYIVGSDHTGPDSAYRYKTGFNLICPDPIVHVHLIVHYRIRHTWPDSTLHNQPDFSTLTGRTWPLPTVHRWIRPCMTPGTDRRFERAGALT